MNLAQNRTQRIKAELAAWTKGIRKQGIYNGVVLVADRDEVWLLEAIGLATGLDGGVKRPLTVDSMFELASVSKPITALGIVLLKQRGELDWEDPVAKWMPELPYPGISIRHLLCHTSGLPDYMELFAEVWDRSQYACNEDVLRMLIEHRPEPLFAPGDQWQYSNTGYILLALLIERISGQLYGDFLDECVFRPQGMMRTRVYNRRIQPEAMPDDYALGYVHRLDHNGYVLPDEVDDLDYVRYLDGLQGDGMVNSTAGDLLRLDRALYDDAFVPAHVRETMFAPVLLNGGEAFHYGFGWLIEQDERLGKVVYHSGGWPGYATMFKRYVDKGLTLILLQNGTRDYSYNQQMIEGIEHILCGGEYRLPEPLVERVIVSLTSQQCQPHEGSYRFAHTQEEGRTMDVEVIMEPGRLRMTLGNGMTMNLLPLSPTRFYEQQTATELEFAAESAGQSMKLIWHNGEETSVAERVV
ncbi:serine hydrolase domain-containing protein [Cohnella sp.]|uniref:serine hydrolase domain-containing protein n=1 Tax=Cohnella sp. TaxID=1883426 RepID=UPI003564AC80